MVSVSTHISNYFRKHHTNLLTRCVSVLSLLLIWWVISILLPHNIIPSPHETMIEAVVIFFSNKFAVNLAITVLRIVIGLSISLLLSIGIGLLTQKNTFINKFVELYIFLGLIVPSTVIAFVVIILLGTSEVSPLLAIIITTTPQASIIVISGLKALNQDLFDVGTIFRISRISKYTDIILPQMAPTLFAVLKTGISVSWKTSMIAEMFAFSSGIGYQIYYQFQLFSMKGVLAWTVAFLFVMGMVDVLLNYLENKTLLWKNKNVLQ